MRTFTDRVAVVTGAASGIGQATAKLLAREGCKLALVDVNEGGLESTRDAIASAGGTASVHVADVSDRERMSVLPAEVLAVHDAAHILVNNAGVSVSGDFDEQTLDDWEWLLGVNLWGVIYGCYFFRSELERADEAWIVNVSSVYGIVGVAGQSSYCTSKFAIRGFTECLWEELRNTHVGVSLVHAGGVATDIATNSRSYDDTRKQKAVAFLQKNAMHPDKAAQKIVDGIRKRRKRILIGKEALAIDWMRRVSPVRGNRIAADKISKKMGLEDR